jgi:hypothetical protein
VKREGKYQWKQQKENEYWIIFLFIRSLYTKLDKDTSKKENYRPIFLRQKPLDYLNRCRKSH